MAAVPDNDDDSLIIILGTSPGASMEVGKCNGIANGELDMSQIEDAMKELSNEANMAFKAQFHLGDSPSPASMMVASTIITEDRSTEELQKRFGDLIDENVVLKETLKQNNDSMKEQFMLIASCQEDMLKTHRLHKEKFDEIRVLVERLRQENEQLKLDISHLAEGDQTNISEHKKTSGFELVTSPEDDTLEKLTLQLELVEKQRRQVIVDNEKLTWQKESLEHIIDAMSKERDDAKLKLQNVELLLSTKETDHAEDVQKLHHIISDLQNKIKVQNSNVSPEEISKRDVYIQQLEGKLSSLQSELKKAQIKIIDLENIKLEFSQHKSAVLETAKIYKEQIQELNNRIKEVQCTVFQPVRISVSSENNSSEFASFMANIKLYDRTLKHLAEFLNGLTDGLSDSLAHALGIVSSLQELKYERGNIDRLRSGLGDLKKHTEMQHSTVVTNIGQIRGTLSIFEGIFKDHNELLKKTLTKTDTASPSVQQLTAALVARGQQLTSLQEDLATARSVNDDREVLRAQVELYKSDFEAERESREKMASEKENNLADLRVAQRKIQELTTQLEELRILSPSLHKSITGMKPRPSSRPVPTTAPPTATVIASYTCPKCMTFSSKQYAAMEEHFEYCLDDF